MIKGLCLAETDCYARSKDSVWLKLIVMLNGLCPVKSQTELIVIVQGRRPFSMDCHDPPSPTLKQTNKPRLMTVDFHDCRAISDKN